MERAITSRQLYDRIEAGTIPMILDVRNQDEYAAWQIEGPRPVPMRNVPIWVAVEDSEVIAQEIPDGTVVVCAHGNGSDLLLDLLIDEGREVCNLEGGTAAWAELLVPRRLTDLPDGVVGWQVQRPSKACLSYVIGVPGQSAIVVDPARFTEPYIELAASEGMTITHVIDTHVHADHITGGPALAAQPLPPGPRHVRPGHGLRPQGRGGVHPPVRPPRARAGAHAHARAGGREGGRGHAAGPAAPETEPRAVRAGGTE